MPKVKSAKDSEIKNQTNTKDSEKKYGLGELRKNCLTLFDVSTSVFDGAVTGLTGEYTISEVKNIILKWKAKEVK